MSDRREFCRFSVGLMLGAFGALSVPNLLFGNTKNSLDIWSAPALIGLPLAIAMRNGKARDMLNLNYKEWRNPDQLRAGFAGGSFMLCASPCNIAANLYNQGVDVKMLNILTNGLNYIFSKNQNINELKDLQGKKLIMSFKNDLPDIIFQALCKAFGVDIEQINITYVQTPPEAVMLFLRREFDAILTQEPIASAMQLKAQNNGIKIHRSIDIQTLWASKFQDCPQIPQAGLIVRGEFYQRNLEFFNTFYNDLQNALKWINSSPNQAAKFGTKYLLAPQDAIKNAIAYSNFTLQKCSDITKSLNNFFEIIYRINPKLIGGKIPSQGLYL